MRAPDWTEAEFDILRAVYPVGGFAAVIKVLPHRTKSAIIEKAVKTLGLHVARRNASRLPKKTSAPQFWTEERVARLGAAIARGGHREAGREFPDCTHAKLKTAARRFGFRIPAICGKWPAERVEVLRAALERGGREEAMRTFPDEKDDALRYAAQRHGLVYGKPMPKRARRNLYPAPKPKPIALAPISVAKRRMPKLTPEMRERWSRLTFTMAVFE